jgi:integrase
MKEFGRSKTRNGTGRRILLNNRATEAMKKWAERFPSHEPNHFVFASERYGMKNNLMTEHMVYNTDPTKPMGSWKKAWNSACAKAKVKCRFHDLRHTAVTRMLEGGVPFNTVAVILGWSASNTVLMIRKYNHLFDRNMMAAVTCLEGGSTEPVVKDSVKEDTSSTAEKKDPKTEE